MNKKLLLIPLALLLAVSLVAIGCPSTPTTPPTTTPPTTTMPTTTPPPAKDTIVIGIATSLSGPLAVIRALGLSPILEMWIDDVNAEGGIYVEEYGKKLPIELITYDDKSDIATMTQLTEKLILEDKVDFLLPSCGTAMLFAQAPIANKYEYILLGAEGGASSLKEVIAGLPYFFNTMNFAEHQMPVLADIFATAGVKTLAITFLEDLHGVEYSGEAVPEFALKGIDVIFVKSHPPGVKDLSALLGQAQAANVDAFCSFSYPDENILITAQSMVLGFNPKAMFLSVGPYAPFFRDAFGVAGVEGIMGCGAWNEKSSPAAAELSAKFKARYGGDPNYWGGVMTYVPLQILEEAIERAGTLDQKKIRDMIATEKFTTVLGETWFEGNMLAPECYLGQIGQWQNGVFEVIDPGAKRTAPPEYPKPAWPAPPE